MKKTVLTFIALLAIIFCFAQSDSSHLKKDTTYVPVFMFEVADTVQVPTLIYQGQRNIVKYSSPGYYIRKAKAVQGKKGVEYVDQPQVIGALDNRKRPVKPI